MYWRKEGSDGKQSARRFWSRAQLRQPNFNKYLARPAGQEEDEEKLLPQVPEQDQEHEQEYEGGLSREPKVTIQDTDADPDEALPDAQSSSSFSSPSKKSKRSRRSQRSQQYLVTSRFGSVSKDSNASNLPVNETIHS